MKRDYETILPEMTRIGSESNREDVPECFSLQALHFSFFSKEDHPRLRECSPDRQRSLMLA